MALVLISGLFGLVGTAVGVVLGHTLGQRSQHKQWVADHRRGEFRRLLTVLNESFMTLMNDNRVGRRIDAETRVTRIIADRIFISGDMKELDVMNRWLKAVRTFDKDRGPATFRSEIEELSEDLRKAALITISGSKG